MQRQPGDKIGAGFIGFRNLRYSNASKREGWMDSQLPRELIMTFLVVHYGPESYMQGSLQPRSLAVAVVESNEAESRSISARPIWLFLPVSAATTNLL